MRRALFVPFVLLLAGCVAPAAELADEPDPGAPAELRAGDVLRWDGRALRGDAPSAERMAQEYACWVDLPCGAPLPACEAANCERRPFLLADNAAAITLSVRWPTSPGLKFEAWLEDASGSVLAVAPHRYVGAVGLVARVTDAPAGEYVAVVAARMGHASYEAAVRIEPATPDGGARQLLPNLVTLPPTDLRLETPDYAGISYFAFSVPGIREVMEAAGTKGCRVDETAEYQAVRCLRFSNSVGNVGEGALDVRLAVGGSSFIQRVHSSDGTFEERPGGAAEWHATHAHWHNAASNHYTLHAYDEVSRAMGGPLGDGRKGGICFADVGVVDVGQATMLPAAESGWSCFQPRPGMASEWTMGITPGWYDLYPYILSDQFVDVSGLEDGTYALCSVTNAEGALLESDLSDNAACTAFALAGDAVTLLEPAPYHTMRE